MNYSIKHKDDYLIVGNDFSPTYIEWQTAHSFSELIRKYQEQYAIQNDVLIYNHSYFEILIDIFINNGCSIKSFINELSSHEVVFSIRNKQSEYYSNLGLEDYQKEVNQDIENITPYVEEIIKKNNLILNEFKDFLTGFSQYLKVEYYQEYSSFKYVYNLLIDDMKFFKNTKIKSLDKYAFSIGGYADRHYESRGKNNDFIPSGYCNYGKEIFINSEHADQNKHGRLWEKRAIQQTFYHEVAHALDYLYYDDIVLKDGIKRQHSSYNNEFLKCCKLGYRRFKELSPKLNKKGKDSLSYFCSPATKKVYKLEKHNLTPLHNLGEQINKDIFNVFNGLKERSPTPIIKNFSPTVKIGDIQYDYSRVLEETWSESFALLFNWIKNSFSEYDKFILTAGKSNDRAFIKTNYYALMYLLDHFDWNKLNIPLSVIIRKKVQIKKLLNYVNNMSIVLNRSSALKFKHTKYLKFNDMLKNR